MELQQSMEGWHNQLVASHNTTGGNLVKIAEYVVANKISSKPAFAWWVPFTIQKPYIILEAVKKRYLSRTHKF
jgi:hypothetical protein